MPDEFPIFANPPTQLQPCTTSHTIYEVPSTFGTDFVMGNQIQKR